MNALNSKKQERMERLLENLTYWLNKVSIACMVIGVLANSCLVTMAANNAGEVIKGVLSIVFLITNIVGIIFVIIGFVKLAIANAQEDGPGQQKAALMIATGLVLILLRIVMGQINFESWIDTSKA